jgi:hypothetical protein
MRVILVAFLVLLVLAPRVVFADDPCGETPSAACILDHAAMLLDRGEQRAALDYLKRRRTFVADEGRFSLLAAQGYLALGNRVWARRILTQRVATQPDDCEARGWLAWVFYSDADLEGARQILDHERCPRTAPERSRWALLRGLVVKESGHPDEARSYVHLARRAGVAYAEDRVVLEHLTASLWPDREPLMEARADLRAGWTSNALLGSPIDPTAAEGDLASPVGDLALWARTGTDSLGLARPFAELEIKSLGLVSQATRELSYVSMGVRPGIAWHLGHALLRSAYRFDTVLLEGGDAYEAGPLWYHQGHRGELELELGRSLTLFGGGGRREFRIMGRSRWELDLGLGGGGALGDRVFMLGALTGRAHRAVNHGYHLFGASALTSLQVRIHGQWTLRAVVSLSYDDYPDPLSRLVFSATQERRDLQIKGRVEFWTPPFAGVRLGAAYAPSHRDSTAGHYSFTDHRVVALVRWIWRADPGRLEARTPEGHVALDYGLAESEHALGDRLQDLLRQDEEARRGSSCLD